MADNKKSFVLYCDLINAIDHLTTLEKGQLFEHLLDYVNDKNPVLKDRVLLGTWKHMEQSLKRDLKKYESRAQRSRDNGALGGRPKKPRKPSGLNNNPDEPRKPDSDSVTVSVNDNVTESVIKNAHEFLYKNCMIDLEAIEMKYVSKIPDWEDMVTFFNLKVEEEQLEYKPRVLIARFQRLCINWIKFSRENKNKKGPKTLAEQMIHLL